MTAAKHMNRVTRRAGSRSMASLLLLRQQSRTCAHGGGNGLVDVETLVREYGIPARIACVLDRERVGHSIRVQLHSESLRHAGKIRELIERLVVALSTCAEAARYSLRLVDV